MEFRSTFIKECQCQTTARPALRNSRNEVGNTSNPNLNAVRRYHKVKEMLCHTSMHGIMFDTHHWRSIGCEPRRCEAYEGAEFQEEPPIARRVAAQHVKNVPFLAASDLQPMARGRLRKVGHRLQELCDTALEDRCLDVCDEQAELRVVPDRHFR